MRTLLIFIAAYIAYLLIKGILFGKTLKRPAKKKKDAVPVRGHGEEAVSCQRCGAYAPLSSAYSVTHHGKSLHFCSEDCWDKFSSSG
ncbi:MAG: hypothetical protein HZB21_06525 [Deltaproteobacteria bacterium]|nr:hypothetical protein [Deltaproteobacteria bacterium]MBI5810823.1 hypothetical protein [Deltaproteobacteria bacterium]